MNKVLLPRFYPLNLVKLISFLLIKKKKTWFIIENKNKATHSLSYQFGAYPSRFFPYKNAFILFLILLTQPFHLVYCIFLSQQLSKASCVTEQKWYFDVWAYVHTIDLRSKWGYCSVYPTKGWERSFQSNTISPPLTPSSHPQKSQTY